MKKRISNLIIKENTALNANYSLLKLTTSSGERLPEMKPGQFVQILVEDSATTYLRRPISISFYDEARNELWLLIQKIGDGTRKICQKQMGETLNLVYPLGNGFTMVENGKLKVESANNPSGNFQLFLLIGGGVGVAPLLYLGSELKKQGANVHFLLGARTKNDLLLLDEFAKYGEVHITTEDGSAGEQGYVTQHSIMKVESGKLKIESAGSPSSNFQFSTINFQLSKIYTCGPTPMMKAVANHAAAHDISCEVSLENTMACGIGACLCCVTQTTGGHKCVCTDGPVFSTNELTW